MLRLLRMRRAKDTHEHTRTVLARARDRGIADGDGTATRRQRTADLNVLCAHDELAARGVSGLEFGGWRVSVWEQGVGELLLLLLLLPAGPSQMKTTIPNTRTHGETQITHTRTHNVLSEMLGGGDGTVCAGLLLLPLLFWRDGCAQPSVCVCCCVCPPLEWNLAVTRVQGAYK